MVSALDFGSKGGSVARAWGPFLEGPEKFSGPGSHNKNFKPYVYRAVLLTQFQYEQS